MKQMVRCLSGKSNKCSCRCLTARAEPEALGDCIVLLVAPQGALDHPLLGAIEDDDTGLRYVISCLQLAGRQLRHQQHHRRHLQGNPRKREELHFITSC